MQGSNMINLPSVLAGGGLLCSDFLRSLSRATFTKDAGNRTGDVCYFRFIKDTRPEGRLSSKIIQENINNGMWNYGAALSLIMLLLIGITGLFSNESSDSANEGGLI